MTSADVCWRAIWGEYIPGNPTIVVKNMEGAGSLKLGNWLKSTAPRDGTCWA